MTEEESKPKKHRLLKILIRLVSGLIILIALLILAVYISFNFFGTKILREMMQRKIYASSQGLYSIDFSDIKINIFTRDISILDFSLIPDTAQYRKMKLQGTAKKNLYKITYQRLHLHKLNFRELYANRAIHLRQMSIARPEILLMGFPDTLTSKKGSFKNVYEDVYPLASQIFKEIQIDSIYVERARISSAKEGKPGKQSLGQYEFSAILRDVSINPFSYHNKQRVFYSRDIDFIIHNVKYSLSDSLYFLQAEDIGFNLVKSRIWGKNIELRPNFNSKRVSHSRQGTFIQLDLPEFSIQGINLYQALTEQKVHLKKIALDLARLKIFHNTSEEAMAARLDPERRKKRKPINKADLYTVIAGQLKSVQIDTLLINNASLDFFKTLDAGNPELRVADMDIAVAHFKLDSISGKQRNRIFYAKDLELNLHDIILKLRDQIHVINAWHVYISTRKKMVDIEDAMLYSDEAKNLANEDSRKNTISVMLPDLQFNNIDLLKVFHKQDLEFSNLIVESPDVHFTKYKKAVKKEGRFRNPQDFFAESNNDVIYDLLKKYVNSIDGDSIIVKNGYLDFHQNIDSVDQKISSGSFDLKMFDFVIDSTHGMNQQGYFYSRDFDLDVKSFTFCSPDNLKHIKVSRAHIATKDSLIEADSISFIRTLEPEAHEGFKKSNTSVTFTVDNVFLQGLNHKKLFLEKVLQANLLMLMNPRISLKAGDPVKITPVPEDEGLAASQELVKFLKISKLYILKGDISFDALERTKSSYFKLKDIDFSVQNLFMKLPDRGKKNAAMRFDSIKLSVKPLRMIVMDSTYEILCDNISLNNYPLDIEAEGIHILPLSAGSKRSKGKSSVTATIPKLKINDFYFDKALFESNWIVGSIIVSNPEAEVSIISRKGKQQGTAKIPLAFPYKSSTGSFRIDSILIKNARTKLHLGNENGVKDYLLDDLQVSVLGFLLDSLNQEGKPGVPLFNAADISISAKGMDFILNDSLYTAGFKRVSLSTGKKNLRVDSISLKPNFSREEFYKVLGYQMDIFTLSMNRIELYNLDFQKLVSQKSIYARSVAISNPVTEVYRDKRVPGRKLNKKYLFPTLIRNIPITLTIDTIKFNNGRARYEEQTGDEPGHVFFSRMNVVVNNLTNDSAALKKNRIMSVDGNSRLMDKGHAQAHFRFDLVNPRDSMWWFATIDSVDLREINPMLTKLLPVRISHGFLNKAKITMVNANDATAVGNIQVNYRNLYIQLDLFAKGSFKKIKNELLTDVANAFLPDDNPDYNGRFRDGIIYFKRDTTKAFFNYIWKSTLSGLKSTVGFNSPEQKEIKKNLRRKAR
ncbi:MAG: hypothetical protein WCO02_16370 [Bacteroidota bacterium]